MQAVALSENLEGQIRLRIGAIKLLAQTRLMTTKTYRQPAIAVESSGRFDRFLDHRFCGLPAGAQRQPPDAQARSRTRSGRAAHQGMPGMFYDDPDPGTAMSELHIYFKRRQ